MSEVRVLYHLPKPRFENKLLMKDSLSATHEKYLGKRVKRGLFIASDGREINADVNGNLNILKKYLLKQETWTFHLWEDLVKVCRTPRLCIIKP